MRVNALHHTLFRKTSFSKNTALFPIPHFVLKKMFVNACYLSTHNAKDSSRNLGLGSGSDPSSSSKIDNEQYINHGDLVGCANFYTLLFCALKFIWTIFYA
jgi:hypothetical protein